MAIKELTVSKVRNLLSEDLRIPPYQRPYSWKPKNARALLNDIVETWRSRTGSNEAPQYAIGTVILYQSKETEGGHLEVVDGQQRLLTLTMLQKLLAGEAIAFPTVDEESAVIAVYRELEAGVRRLKEERGIILNYLLNACVLIRVETDDHDEAFRFFDAQNYRGKSLRPHDLLKAYHLREMQDESPASKAAIVEKWEQKNDDDLEELFAKYLFRIARWSRHERAGVFTVRDIDEFKGVSPRDYPTPVFAYHYAAQLSVPSLVAWAAAQRESNHATVSDPRSRDAQRARFQLDAPIIAGRHFFEFVDFMSDERDQLRRECFGLKTEEKALPPDRQPIVDDHYRSSYRYQYAAELFLCAMLYYTNKFGVGEPQDYEEARARLFAWAYIIRLDYQRMSWVAVDKYAVQGGTVQDNERHQYNVFALIRNALSQDAIRRLPLSIPENSRMSKDDALLNRIREVVHG